MITKNEFFNPDDCDFEVLGFYEVLMDARTNKVLGDRMMGEQLPTRPTGAPGMIEYDITENLELVKGHKTKILKASPEKPRRVVGMIRIIGGWKKEKPKPK